jgi:hypothetical protein
MPHSFAAFIWVEAIMPQRLRSGKPWTRCVDGVFFR